MKEYIKFYKVWYRKTGKSNRAGFVLRKLINANFKAQMSITEGLVFISIMKRTYNLTRKGKRNESGRIY